MYTSARNQFTGTVAKIAKGAVNAEVALKLAGDLEVVASITLSSLERLGLKEGQSAIALIKAPQVILVSADTKLKFSARNHLTGKVSSIEKGAVNTVVSITLAGGNTLKSVITEDALSDLGLKDGGAVCAIFKSSSVILAVE
ncbi:TOBE domain-containing protein [Beggiatoa leptomitoformis]|uniref:Transporter n=1 Tax=Beggiatoa leptomitoformis TaxID=288004 RepID=A0A2N9YBW4_9GAMM|nr:TOBE domain-containing protein [Beggiatoa leptomitoformis]ALG66742.1 transporter [Beggiatoa leptomitoformis]AUI67919.1 transporter [Beggiatoa leptomitoformis]